MHPRIKPLKATPKSPRRNPARIEKKAGANAPIVAKVGEIAEKVDANAHREANDRLAMPTPQRPPPKA
jgi:hypothetical protein